MEAMILCVACQQQKEEAAAGPYLATGGRLQASSEFYG